jgi:outer membrane murein-binding lipoprotein Lpp
MIRLYIAAGILATFVVLGGWAMLERAGRQLADQKAAALRADLAAATGALEAERANARKSATVAAEQAKRAREAQQEVQEVEGRARAIIEDLMREQIERPDTPECDCSLSPDWIDRLRQDIPIRSAPRPVPSPTGQLRLNTLP